MPARARSASAWGFTLVELLVVIAIVGVLAGLLVPVVGAARSRARSADCGARIRGLGQAVLLHAAENRGVFPRSFHSAAAHREAGWAAAIAPILGAPAPETDGWPAAFNRLYRCPSDDTTDVWTYSYALNVHFELDPAGDDYAGSPATWRGLERVPVPSRTILLAEPRPVAFGDHLMAHLWGSANAAKNALAHDRHAGRAHYTFCDGHVSALRAEETFDPASGRDLWNPSRTR